MAQQYPRPWEWAKEKLPLPLSSYVSAPDKIGFYELGLIVNGVFKPQYAGRAKGITLRQRLGQHFRYSHNKKAF